jgi:TetR/AcrR family transcriptional regulator, multidrug resistance operon repressor
MIADKKKAILESTLKLINENGFHGTPMSLVAKKAGVAAGTIYHYFDSKDTLILDLYYYTQYRVLDAVKENIQEGMDYKTMYLHRWISRVKFYIQNPDSLFFMEQFVNSPYNKKCSKEDDERFHNEVVQFIDTGIAQKLVRPMNTILLCIMIHSTSLTVAKLHLAQRVVIDETELQQLAQMSWDSIKLQEELV